MLFVQVDTLRVTSAINPSFGSSTSTGTWLALLGLAVSLIGLYLWLRRSRVPAPPNPSITSGPVRPIIAPASSVKESVAPQLPKAVATPPAPAIVSASTSASSPSLDVPLGPTSIPVQPTAAPIPTPVSPAATPPPVAPKVSLQKPRPTVKAKRPVRSSLPALSRLESLQPTLEPEHIPAEIKYIGYSPIPVRVADRYPLVRMPAADRPIPVKFPRAGRVGQRGYCEAVFVEYLRRYFPKGGPVRVFDDRHLPIREAARPYEPDVALLNERNGLNLFLNIEVDEPYEAVYRTPTHYQGADLGRDLFFTNRGWIVLRFAEIQVHQHPDACCAVVAKLIARLDPSYQVPAELQDLVPPPAVPMWSIAQAQQWEKTRYREQYLGIEQFGRYAESDARLLTTEVLPVEVEIEKLVEQVAPPPKPPRPSRLQRENPDLGQKILRFDADKHEYTIHGRPATAVSTLVKEFFPEFDTPYWSARKSFERGCTAEEVAAEWSAKALASSMAGTALHLLIEDFYNNGRTTSVTPEFAHFLSFHQQHQHLIPHRTEWQVFNEELMLAGTIDFVARNNDGTLSIYDWKRSQRVVNAAGQLQLNAYQPAEGPLKDLPECSFSHYTLQQNVYKWLLEASYKCRVRDMNLVVLHPDYDRFHLVPVPERPAHVAHMLAAVRARR